MSGYTEQVIERRSDGTARASGWMPHEEAVELAREIAGSPGVEGVSVRPVAMAPTATPPGAELDDDGD